MHCMLLKFVLYDEYTGFLNNMVHDNVIKKYVCRGAVDVQLV